MSTKKIRTFLLDGYLDEPSCLGVPPYISPHIRYVYGALLDSGIPEEYIDYKTIDEFRTNWDENIEKIETHDLFIIIAGTTVPGNYLGGRPISLAEIKRLGQKIFYPTKVLGGPITLVKNKLKGFDFLTKETAAFDLYSRLKDISLDQLTNEAGKNISKWANLGAKLTKRHPSYPNIVCELETFRGCPRSKHCTFCSERLKKLHYRRTPQEIISEVKSLADLGNHYYRLGCQTDILSYATDQNNKLKPKIMEKLYQGINQADPDLKVLHLDNINPATLINQKEQAKKILEIITKYNTEGDTAAFGLESADPKVLEKNNIEANSEVALEAIELLNEIGGKRKNGVSKLLPGINFLHGLIGERKETMDYNYNFLKEVYDRGLMLRRINIRQVVQINNYPVESIDKNKFEEYKKKVNKEINKPMLKRVFPTNTVLKDVLIEKVKGKLSYGRQLGTYPILVAVPGKLKLNKFYDIKIIDHGYRSITGIPWPTDIYDLTADQLSFIPGIGKKRASNIFLEKPSSFKDVLKLIDNQNTKDTLTTLFNTVDQD
ncbi:MAG: radical SAM protein [Halanaerobiales bacterium]|nr:radical SAM protein [Halanaerobiales bacterium]